MTARTAQRSVPLILIMPIAMLYTSCASLSQDQIIANERTRLQQERRGYFDPENSVQQKKADERAHHEALRRKS
jgi:hypothetical protein